METPETNFVKQYEPDKQARVELKNGRILDVINGCYFDAGTSVILQAGKIESMPEHEGEPRVPVDFTIDLKGKTLLPSFYNTHIHLLMTGAITMVLSLSEMRRVNRYLNQQLEKNLADCLTHGVTHVRDAWRPDLRDNQAIKDRISKGEIHGPRILQAVAVGLPGSYLQEKATLMSKFMMPSADPTKDYAGAVTFPMNANEQQVRDAVDRAIDERGAEAIKIGEETVSFNTRKPLPIMTFEQLCAVADQARRRGVQSTMHHTSVESFRRGVKAGVSSLAHIPIDSHLTQPDIEALNNSGCIIEPTSSAAYGLSWKLKGDQWHDHPDLDRLTAFRNQNYPFSAVAEEYFIPELRSVVTKGYTRLANGNPKMFGLISMSGTMGRMTKFATIGFENFSQLYEQGIMMGTGNDTMGPCTPAMMQLELLIMDLALRGKQDRVSFNGAEAVKIATINSARSLGLEEKFGSVETGKTADLVILDGDPLEDFRLIGGRVAALFMDGKLVINNCGLELESNGKM